MTNIIILLAELIVSWALVWFLYKKNLSVLGISPTKKRLVDFIAGFLIAAICCCIYFIAYSIFTHAHWIMNTAFGFTAFVKGCWLTLIAVLIEELIFRGVLLYIAIEKFGIKTACIASAVAFGIYHWFATNALGHPVQMVTVFCTTAIWGWTLAYAFAKTKSLYLPVALHLGWNLVMTEIFSRGAFGSQLLISIGEENLKGIFKIAVIFLLQTFLLPALAYIYLKRRKTDAGFSLQ